ncbi:MAG: hypothetical protein ACI8VC_002838 [Candidatus Endobugula sp.]
MALEINIDAPIFIGDTNQFAGLSTAASIPLALKKHSKKG